MFAVCKNNISYLSDNESYEIQSCTLDFERGVTRNTTLTINKHEAMAAGHFTHLHLHQYQCVQMYNYGS